MQTDHLSRDIHGDVAAGEQLLTLRQALKLPELANPRDGQPHSVSWIHRAHLSGVRGAGGRRVKLEAVTRSGVFVTSPSAVRRFLHRQIAEAEPDKSLAPKSRLDVDRQLAGSNI